MWLFIISGQLWNVNTAGFLLLLNDYIVHNTSMDKDEAALGVTIMGNFIKLLYLHVQLIGNVQKRAK